MWPWDDEPCKNITNVEFFENITSVEFLLKCFYLATTD